MPHCPECRAEYEEGIERCTDCDVPLAPGGAPPDDWSDWEVVRSVGTDSEASLIAGLLEAEEIPVAVENIRVHALPETFGDLADVRVRVPSASLEAAEKVLAQHEKAFAGAADDDEALVTDEGVAHLEDEPEEAETE